jgi:BNR/Asp-box repeat protein
MRAVVLILAASLAGCSAMPTSTSPRTESPAAAETPSRAAMATVTPTPAQASGTPSGILYPTISAISAPSDSVVWVVIDSDRLFRSTDGGETWDRRPTPASYPNGPISFVDDSEGWLVRTGSPAMGCMAQFFDLWHTADGATTWEVLVRVGLNLAPADVSFGQCKGPLAFADRGKGVLMSSARDTAPTVYRTRDGGRSWMSGSLGDPPGFTTHPDQTPRPQQMRWFGSTLLLEAQTWVEGKSIRYVFRSTDAGARWSYLRSMSDAPEPIVFVTPARWLRLSYPTASESTDGGATWHKYATDYQQGAAPVPPNVVFADASVGYAAVRFSLQRTVDGGAHWSALRMPGL